MQVKNNIVKNNWDEKNFAYPTMLRESFEGRCSDFGKWPNVSLVIFGNYFGNRISHFTLEVNDHRTV